MTRGQHGRRIGRVLIAIASGAVGLTLGTFMAARGIMGPDWLLATPPVLFGLPAWSVVLGVAVVGCVWMIRIHRADPEPDMHAWRYRAR